MSRIMVTNGGPHPADKWAVVTAEHIFPISDTVQGDRLLMAKKFQLALAEALVPHHAGAAAESRDKLKQNAAAHMASAPNPLERAKAAMAAIVALAKGGPWEEHFNKPDVQQVVIQEVGNHFATVDHIERSWHADRNPDAPESKVFRAAHHTPTIVGEEQPAVN